MDYDGDFSSDDDSDNEASKEADVLEEEQTVYADFEGDVDVASQHNIDVEAPEVPKKQKFKNLDAVLDEHRYTSSKESFIQVPKVQKYCQYDIANPQRWGDSEAWIWKHLQVQTWSKR